jgi:N-methylhydantoinase A
VTDAHLVLGRLGPEGLLGRSLPLDRGAAREAVARLASGLGLGLEETAEGILRVAAATMERALRTISVERGHDPRGFAMVAFGGAGPLHGAELAEALGVPRLLVPRHPGALSALGMILAGPRRDLSLTLLSDLADLSPRRIERGFRELEEKGRAEIEAEGAEPAAVRCERSADLRYRGQSFELEVAWGDDPAAAFHEAHRRRFGLARREAPVELVALRVAVSAPGADPAFPEKPEGPPDPRGALVGEEAARLGGRAVTLSVYDREGLLPGHRVPGPARISEFSATTLVPAGWVASVDGHGQLRLSARGAEW